MPTSSSDTEDEDFLERDDTTAIDTSSLVQASSAASAVETPTSVLASTDAEVAVARQCNMCEILRMRKPDTVGCRQCLPPANKQTATKVNNDEAVETKAATNTRDEDAIGVRTRLVLCLLYREPFDLIK